MSTKKPMVLFMAGPNGSGKSTITQYFEIVGEYTNADDMVKTIGMSNEEAAILADKKDMSQLIRKQTSHLKLFFHQNTSWIF